MPQPLPTRTEPPDPGACPLCHQPNRCAMELARATAQPPQTCWCAGLDFSAELLARVPAEAQRLACICAACARRSGAA